MQRPVNRIVAFMRIILLQIRNACDSIYVMKTGQIIKNRRKELGISADELADKIGVSRSTMFRYENGDIEKLPADVLEPISSALDTTPAYLMGWTNDPHAKINNIEPIGDTAKFEVIGSIAAGYNGNAIEEFTGDYIDIPQSMLQGEPKSNYFILRVKGESMYPKFLDGDRVFVHRCTSVDSGSVAVIVYNGDEATIKTVEYVFGEDWVRLVPYNREYSPKLIRGADLQECHVLGQVVLLLRTI